MEPQARRRIEVHYGLIYILLYINGQVRKTPALMQVQKEQEEKR